MKLSIIEIYLILENNLKEWILMKNLNEEELIENRKIREKMMNEANLSIFNKFKEIVFLDDNEVVTINQVAEYYEVTNRTI